MSIINQGSNQILKPLLNDPTGSTVSFLKAVGNELDSPNQPKPEPTFAHRGSGRREATILLEPKSSTVIAQR
jgi:hypothetical protein